MKVTFAHVCDYASVSRDGKLSVIGIFDRLFTSALPTSHPLMYLAFELEMRPSEVGRPLKLGIVLVDADGGKTFETTADVTFGVTVPSGEVVRIPQMLAFGGLPILKLGKYAFDIFINGDHKGSASFEVSSVDANPAQGLRQ